MNARTSAEKQLRFVARQRWQVLPRRTLVNSYERVFLQPFCLLHFYVDEIDLCTELYVTILLHLRNHTFIETSQMSGGMIVAHVLCMTPHNIMLPALHFSFCNDTINLCATLHVPLQYAPYHQRMTFADVNYSDQQHYFELETCAT